MDITTAKLVCFSPTGTTRAVLEGFARGFAPETTELVDITRPDVRARPLRLADGEMLVIGVPVYMGRVPALLGDWLAALEGDGAPAVCVAVYGNREYEDALLELKDIVSDRGCVPVAGAAYIGEHSFSNEETASLGRPDTSDMAHAEAFGAKVREKLQGIASLDEVGELKVPGVHPYGGRTELWDVDFIAVDRELCTQCGLCAEVCPVEAIDAQDGTIIDEKKCITCCACIKSCPEGARSIKPGPVKDAQGRINSLFTVRKEPELFL
jgi:ferredoxin